jgi:hypothetical protein
LGPNGGRVQLALGHGGRQGPKLLGPGGAGPN